MPADVASLAKFAKDLAKPVRGVKDHVKMRVNPHVRRGRRRIDHRGYHRIWLYLLKLVAAKN